MKKLIINLIWKQIRAQGFIFLLELVQCILIEVKANRFTELNSNPERETPFPSSEGVDPLGNHQERRKNVFGSIFNSLKK